MGGRGIRDYAVCFNWNKWGAEGTAPTDDQLREWRFEGKRNRPPPPFDALNKIYLRASTCGCPGNIHMCALWPKRETSPGIKGRFWANPVRGAGKRGKWGWMQKAKWRSLWRSRQVKTARCYGRTVCSGQRTLVKDRLTGTLGHTVTRSLATSECHLGEWADIDTRILWVVGRVGSEKWIDTINDAFRKLKRRKQRSSHRGIWTKGRLCCYCCRCYFFFNN